MSATSRSRLLALVLGLTVLLAPGTAAAKGGDDAAGSDDGGGGTATAAVAGDFAVTVNGRTTNPAAGREARLRDVTPIGPIVWTANQTDSRRTTAMRARSGST